MFIVFFLSFYLQNYNELYGKYKRAVSEDALNK